MFCAKLTRQPTAQADQDCLRFALQLAVSRKPADQEIAVLQKLLQDERKRLTDNPQLVDQRIGTHATGYQIKSADRTELAAWTAVTNALLNLDETIHY
ncbi:MAG: hypothetical protein R3C28_23995 [Pirellulaceae bacterium]